MCVKIKTLKIKINKKQNKNLLQKYHPPGMRSRDCPEWEIKRL